MGLYIGVTLAAAAFGSTWPLTVVTTSELWGMKNHGSNYMMFDGCTSAFCTLTLAKFVAQHVYTEHIKDNSAAAIAARGGLDSSTSGSGSSILSGHTCLGTDCFREAHVIEIGCAPSSSSSSSSSSFPRAL